MRKLILFNMQSLDGFFEGPGNDLDWHNTDQEFDQYSIDQLDTAGALVFGRVTYELMASYWPAASALEMYPQVAERMNRLPKLVFSRTLNQVDWQNTRLVKTDPAAEITRWKNEPGADLFVFGSANLSATLMARRVIDELRVMVNPVILGSGTPLFQGIDQSVRLALTGSRTFANGNVLLTYIVQHTTG